MGNTNTDNETRSLGKKDNDDDDNDDEEVPLMSMNHVSRLCRDVKQSVEFYTKVLGMVLIERPPALEDFDGAWLFNFGVGIHLVQAKDHQQKSLPDHKDHPLDPMDNHISFQCEDMNAIEGRLKKFGIKYIKRTMEDDSTAIDQLFFNDPDGFMIEICNCENIKLVPSQSMSISSIKLPAGKHNPPLDLTPPKKLD